MGGDIFDGVYLFDLDDTLIASVTTLIPDWQRAAKASGLPHKSVEQWRAAWGGAAVEFLQRLYASEQITKEKAEEILYNRQNDANRAQQIIPAFPGAHKAIKLLSNKGVVGIVTSREHARADTPKYKTREGMALYSLLEYVVDSSGFDLFDFDFIIGCDYEPNVAKKPDPKVFDIPEKILRQQGRDLSGAYYIGDHVSDYKAAAGRGLKFVGVLTGTQTENDFLKAGCPRDCLLESVADLPKYLEAHK